MKAASAKGPVGSFGHHRHPLIGCEVQDVETGRTGTLQAVMDGPTPMYGRSAGAPLAYVRPEGGGIEWTAGLEHIRPADGRRDPRSIVETASGVMQADQHRPHEARR